ncbi:dihydroorotate dehydrogenase-like protein [Bellilinea sp.]|uniref:dihydroorotate dehydrogenase-like protein n=1 Tax=Bellilinea sp. TaxID=2838785 RepID=UPI002ADDE87F|nr:dihydroorotate dehydrogenase-like protein [Bellilinea sp.]
MADLTTTYLGLKLKNPLVASASPLSKKVEGVQRLEEAGISAVVMYSLFEEQIVHESQALDHYLTRGSESFAEALTYFPDLERYNVGPESYLELIYRIKKAVRIPVIGSLNGISTGGWINYAKRIEEAGADALELNIYYVPTDPKLTGQELEQTYVQLVRDVRSQISIPLAVKLSPYFSALPNMAAQLAEAGANGLVLFNRFYQPDLDIESLEVVPNLVLSTSDELRLPLRWVAILYGRIKADLALSSGVHSATDVVKALMAGANVAMTTSELLAKGIGRATEILTDLNNWLDEFEYTSVQQMIGSMSHKAVGEPAAFERANYMKALQSFDNRIHW